MRFGRGADATSNVEDRRTGGAVGGGFGGGGLRLPGGGKGVGGLLDPGDTESGRADSCDSFSGDI